jgi:hypothetical protein
MQQIHVTNNVAPKLGGIGALEYQLWVDDGGSLYVGMIKNSDEGTFPSDLFSVARYAALRHGTDLGQLVGVDSNGKEREATRNINTDAFLRAVLRHLLDGGAAA